MEIQEFIAADLCDLPTIAKQIIAICEKSNLKVVAFYGGMGAGKTTLIKEIGKVLDVEDIVLSPTFAIVNEYQTGSGNLMFHFDFYRITKEIEAVEVGSLEYFASGHYCFIEWSENIPNLLPEHFIKVSISELENHQRKIVLNYQGVK